MKTLGLTGGVGMGKSACAQLLAARGALVVDTDELARQVVEPQRRHGAFERQCQRFNPG